MKERTITSADVEAAAIFTVALAKSKRTHEEVAAEVGVSPGMIHQWSKPLRPISLARAPAVAKAVGIDDPGKISVAYREWHRAHHADAPTSDAGAATGIFTKERRADDDVLALQMAVESLTLALLQKAPGAAAVFLADVEQVAKESRFSMNQGLFAKLSAIARRVQKTEEEAARALRRGGSAGSTKP